MEKIEKKGLDFNIRGGENLGVRCIGASVLIEERNTPKHILDQIENLVKMGFPDKTEQWVPKSVEGFIEMIRTQCQHENDIEDKSIVLVIPEHLIPIEFLLTLCSFSVGKDLSVKDFRNVLHDTTRVVDFMPANPYLIKTEILEIDENLAGKILNQENYGNLLRLLKEKNLRWLSIEEALAAKRERLAGPIILNAFYERPPNLGLSNALRKQRGLGTITAKGIMDINIGVIQGHTLDFVTISSDDNGFEIPRTIVATGYYMP